MDVSSHSLKRPRSASPPPESAASTSEAPRDAESLLPTRAPKRLRRAHANEPISQETLGSMANANPLNRRNAKRDAKRARRAGRPVKSPATFMETDEHVGLNGTFFSQSFADQGAGI